MTVAELIAELQKLPQDLNVWVEYRDGFTIATSAGVCPAEAKPTRDPEWNKPKVLVT